MERVFAERKVLLQLADEWRDAALPGRVGPRRDRRLAVDRPSRTPPRARSTSRGAAGAWARAYLAEIVYVVSAAVVGDDYAGARSYPGADASASAAPSDLRSARAASASTSAKRHFLVTQKSPPGVGPGRR